MAKTFYDYQISGKHIADLFGSDCQIETIIVQSDEFNNDIEPFNEIEKANEFIFSDQKITVELNDKYFPVKTKDNKIAFDVDDITVGGKKYSTLCFFTLGKELFAKISTEATKKEEKAPGYHFSQRETAPTEIILH